MNSKRLKIVLAALAEKIEEQAKEIRIKEFTINQMQAKLKKYEDKEY